MTQWVRAEAVGAWGPEFKSQASMKRPGMTAHVCNPSIEKWRWADPESSLASLAEIVSDCHREGREKLKSNLNSSSVFQMHTHGYMHACTYHTYKTYRTYTCQISYYTLFTYLNISFFMHHCMTYIKLHAVIYRNSHLGDFLFFFFL